ncbi:MAG: ABC transporter substrate-binding protein [Oscillospiraceae bacterium]|nr:ABC transporter substrate-binding protein [Oscillospiraceae bacterium]
MKNKRLIALILAVLMLVAVVAACGTPDDPTPEPLPATPADDPDPGDDPPDEPQLGREPFVRPPIVTELPREETLYFMGFNWGPPNGWNAFGEGNMNNPLVSEQVGRGARLPVFETPFMFNALDGSLIPLLAEGPYTWNADRTELTYRINPAAFWSDGTKVTAHDAAFTFEAGLRYNSGMATQFASVIDRIEALDDETVVIHAALTADGQPVNPMMILTFLGQNYILQKAWLETLSERHNGNGDEMLLDPAEDIVFSGPFAPFFFDDSIVVLIRDDGYWGQHPSMWGTLPAPRFLAHPLLEDNAAYTAAFMAGDIDVSQVFIPNIEDLWLEQDLPISTFMEEAPFGIALSLPTAFFNMNSEQEAIANPLVRRAIAMAVNYDLIIANAMTNQSPTFAEVPRSLMNPTAPEQAMFNHAEVAHLQWEGNDIDGANAMLDEAGAARGPDGVRVYNGQRMSLVVSAPFGWSDWEAAIEVVAAAGAAIGVEMTTYFPDWSVYQTVVTAASQTEYDIFMMWTDDASPAQPWSRIRNLMTAEFVGNDSNWSGNWGQYVNPRVDELLALIPLETNEAATRALYTELVEIYLTEVPSFTLMYRPGQFHAVNESVWTGFTEDGDGRNVPPLNAVNGFAIADLFNIRLVG